MPQHCAILTVLVISLFTIFTTGMLSFQIPEWSIPCAPLVPLSKVLAPENSHS